MMTRSMPLLQHMLLPALDRRTSILLLITGRHGLQITDRCLLKLTGTLQEPTMGRPRVYLSSFSQRSLQHIRRQRRRILCSPSSSTLLPSIKTCKAALGFLLLRSSNTVVSTALK